MIMTSRLSKHIPFHCWQILTGGVSLVVWEQSAFPDSEGTQIRQILLKRFERINAFKRGHSMHA